MKIKMSDTSALAADQPKTFLGKILTATPIVMTVVATLLAGLSNSEMTRAQYMRSLAAQQQSKVGDQWAFFQAKRQRGTILKADQELLQATVEIAPLDANAVRALAEGAAPPDGLTAALGHFTRGDLPAFTPRPLGHAGIEAALAAVAAGKEDDEVLATLKDVKPDALQAAVRTAQDNARGFDAALSPVAQVIDRLSSQLAGKPGVSRELARGLTAARFRYEAVRYDAEARFNRAIAEVIELQVRQSNATAERHRVRSQRFFFGMLGAQCAVILATFALAVQRRNLVWGFATVIGLGAVGFGVYVYLYM